MNFIYTLIAMIFLAISFESFAWKEVSKVKQYGHKGSIHATISVKRDSKMDIYNQLVDGSCLGLEGPTGYHITLGMTRRLPLQHAIELNKNINQYIYKYLGAHKKDMEFRIREVNRYTVGKRSYNNSPLVARFDAKTENHLIELNRNIEMLVFRDFNKKHRTRYSFDSERSSEVYQPHMTFASQTIQKGHISGYKRINNKAKRKIFLQKKKDEIIDHVDNALKDKSLKVKIANFPD